MISGLGVPGTCNFLDLTKLTDPGGLVMIASLTKHENIRTVRQQELSE